MPLADFSKWVEGEACDCLTYSVFVYLSPTLTSPVTFTWQTTTSEWAWCDFPLHRKENHNPFTLVHIYKHTLIFHCLRRRHTYKWKIQHQEIKKQHRQKNQTLKQLNTCTYTKVPAFTFFCMFNAYLKKCKKTLIYKCRNHLKSQQHVLYIVGVDLFYHVTLNE